MSRIPELAATKQTLKMAVPTRAPNPLSAMPTPLEKTTQTLRFPVEFTSAVEKLSGKKLNIRKNNGVNELTITIPAGDLAVIDLVEK